MFWHTIPDSRHFRSNGRRNFGTEDNMGVDILRADILRVHVDVL